MAAASNQLPASRYQPPAFPTKTKFDKKDLLDNLRAQGQWSGHQRTGGGGHRRFNGRQLYGNRDRGEIWNQRTTARPVSTTSTTTEDHEGDHEDDRVDDDVMDHGEEDPSGLDSRYDTHDLDHSNQELCVPISSQHKAYIQSNLEALQKRCDEFQACTNELYSTANFHGILQGDPIGLDNICGLIYANGRGHYTTLQKKCTLKERDAIREDIGNRFDKELSSSEWRKLDKCIKEDEIPSPSKPAIDIVCRMKKNSTVLCGNADVEEKTEIFFNHELEHLHCSCEVIKSEAANMNKGDTGHKLPEAARIAIVGGIFGLIFLLFIVVVVLCVRHRKMKRRLSRQRIKYLPSPHDEASAVYQEIGDPPGMRRDREPVQVTSPGYHFLERAPTLPARHIRPPKSASNKTDPGDVEYLEPIPDPVQDQQDSSLPANSTLGNLFRNDTVGQSGGYNSGEPAYDLARNPSAITEEPTGVKHPSGSDYERVIRNNSEEDGGYSSLRYKKPPVNGTEQGELELGACDGEPKDIIDGVPKEPTYFVLEPQDDQNSEHEPLTIMTQL